MGDIKEQLSLLLKELFCRGEGSRITTLESEAQENSTKMETMTTKAQQYVDALNEQRSQIGFLNDEIKRLKGELPIQIPDDIKKLSLEIRNKYPAATIVYKGYAIKLKDTVVTPEIRVQDFIHMISSHHRWVKSKGLHLKYYLNNNPDLSFAENFNDVRRDLLAEHVKRKTYIYDSELYGVDEQWAPALDGWYLKKMDCEGSTNEALALFEAAGLGGILRSFNWNVCGYTYSGYGHSTINALDLVDKVHRHLETTVTRVKAATFSDFPEWTDKADQSNIKDVWWSFNSDIARHTFTTAGARKSYEKRKRFQRFIIK